MSPVSPPPPQALPQSQQPEVFGMHENVDISKELQETKQLFDNVLLTQGRGEGGAGSRTDEQLFNIATDILSKVNTLYQLIETVHWLGSYMYREWHVQVVKFKPI